MVNNRIVAIMGPSGAGKTTLANNLSNRLNLVIPRHCTTRNPRKDDEVGFYRYLSHEDYKREFDDGKFLISSGDAIEIKREYGNFYGVLKSDCLDAWDKSDTIILFTSYKDIMRLTELKRCGISVDIVNLTYTDIEQGVKSRLIGNMDRNHSKEDIESRIRCALNDTHRYKDELLEYAKISIFTDKFDIEETYEKVCADLCLVKK